MALDHFRKAPDLPDALFTAGVVALKRGRYEEAVALLEKARNVSSSLGALYARYGIAAHISLPITDRMSATVGVNERGALLALAEVYQKQDRYDEAIGCLEALKRLEPEDPVVKLSLAELLFESRRYPGVVRLLQGMENKDAIHTGCLLYLGKALMEQGLHDAALSVLTAALRPKKDRPEELLWEIRYRRALAYEKLGRSAQARKELERLYSEAPDFEDVAQRLGVS